MIDLLTQYIEHALSFERLADGEANPKLKTAFETQAHAYRMLAARLANKLGFPPPSRPERTR